MKLEKIEHTKEQGTVLYVRGADLMDGTPIYDLKPYLAYTDSHPDATGGFTENIPKRNVSVVVKDDNFYKIPMEKQKEIIKILEHDPTPSYKKDGEIYGMSYGGYDVKFYIENNFLYIISI